MSPSLSRRGLLGAGVAAGLAGAGGVTMGRRLFDSDEPAAPHTMFAAHQPGIATPPQAHLVFAAYDLTTDSREAVATLLASWTAAAEQLMAGRPAGPNGAVPSDPGTAPDDTGEAIGLDPSGLSITIGVGPDLFNDAAGKDRLGLADRRPALLRALPRFPLDALDESGSGGALCLQVCADDAQVALHAVRNLTRIGFGTVGLRWTQQGFGPSAAQRATSGTGRNLMGFKDGTRNIDAADSNAMATHVWVDPADDQAWLAGGTYLVARRAAIRIETWDRQTLADQEAFVGRSKRAGAPLSGRAEFDEPDLAARDAAGALLIPADAHIRVVSPEANGGVRMLRRGYNISDGADSIGRLDAGLFFLAFVRDPETQFIPVQQAMVRHDALMEYLRFTRSGLFAVLPGARPGGYVGEELVG